MKTNLGIKSSTDGYVCPSCTIPYPSLYWFKRDAHSGRILCLECARSLPPGQLEDILQVAVRETENRSRPAGIGPYLEVLVVGMLGVAWVIKEQEILQVTSQLDPRLGRDPLRILLLVCVALLGARLTRLAVDLAASRWPRLGRLLRGNPNAP